jgi:hypothetical protein
MDFLGDDRDATDGVMNQPTLTRYTSDEMLNLAIQISREEALRKEEEKRKEMEEIIAEIENAEKIPIIQKENSEEIKIAIAASLMTHEVESSRSNFNTRTNRILQSLPPPPPGRVHQCIELAKGSGGLLVGAKFAHSNTIARNAGGNCSIRFLPRNISTQFDGEMGDCLIIEADNMESVEAAEIALMTRATEILFSDRKPAADDSDEHGLSVPLTPPPTNILPEIRRHIILDNSNVFISAQSFAMINNRPDPTIRIRANILASILNPSSKNGLRVVAGSKPPVRGKIWQHWESCGYQVKVCSRDIDTGAEDLVDDFLHAQAMRIVLNRQDDPPGENTLVLCTGDGNKNHNFSNFVEVARNTARRGWRVEIWSWRHSRSRKYLTLSQEFPHLVTLHDLDSYADQVIFR